MPPGAIGRLRLQRGGPLSGYIQPVEIHAPPGVEISAALGGAFEPSRPAPRLLGLLVAPTYRLRVTNIPRQEGMEVFPTVEVIDRLYPPAGETLRFPVPIELTQRELQLALEGHFITRVIYIEDPRRATPRAQEPGRQRWFEVRTGEDPLVAADYMGRPVAILRMGGRLPDATGPDAQFLFGSPPVVVYPDEEPVEADSPPASAPVVVTDMPDGAAPIAVPPTGTTDGAAPQLPESLPPPASAAAADD